MRCSAPPFPALQTMLARLGCGRRHRQRRRQAVGSLRQATLCQLEDCLGPAVPETLLAQNAAAAHSRTRIFTLARTLWCWVWQVLQGNTSCREVVRQVQALFAAHGTGLVDEETGAYCQARQKLAVTLLQQLCAATARSAEQAALGTAAPRLRGRPLKVIDASSVRLADTPSNRAAFPPSTSLAAGTGFPMMRLGALFSLQSGALLAEATSSLRTQELQLLRTLTAHLEPGDIVLADRAYGLFVIAAWLRAKGVDLLSAVSTRNRKVNFAAAHEHLGPGDTLFVWKKPAARSKLLTAEEWAQLPAQLTVRLIQVQVERPGFRSASFVLVTTLLDPVAYPAAELRATYTRRWRLEMTFDDLKTTLGMEQLRCQSPAMVRKELLVYLSAHNLLRWVLAKAAAQESVALERLSFKGALDGLRQWSQAMAQSGQNKRARARLWREFLRSLARDLLPERPGRHEPRAVKKRSKYPHMNSPRREYVAPSSRNARRRSATAKKKATTLN